MRLVRFEHEGTVRAGVVEGDVVRDAGESITAVEPYGAALPLADVRLRCPIAPGAKIVCVGLNYRDHAEESGQPIPASPILFAKFSSSLAGPGDPIRIPAFVTQPDYEAELGVVIGRRASGVPKERALEHVLGYTCVNDVSARDLQFADGQWVRGKSLDTFCPVGPWVVTADEIPDPQGLRIRCILNGEVAQDSSTGNMVFGVAELVSFISQGITLEPGDIIATGTPPGVGFARTPPVYLRPGDVVRVEIEGIGTLENPVTGRL